MRESTRANLRRKASSNSSRGGRRRRVFGSKPGAYGAGLQVLIDEGGWDKRADIADVYLSWSAYAYGSGRGRR